MNAFNSVNFLKVNFILWSLKLYITILSRIKNQFYSILRVHQYIILMMIHPKCILLFLFFYLWIQQSLLNTFFIAVTLLYIEGINMYIVGVCLYSVYILYSRYENRYGVVFSRFRANTETRGWPQLLYSMIHLPKANDHKCGLITMNRENDFFVVCSLDEYGMPVFGNGIYLTGNWDRKLK